MYRQHLQDKSTTTKSRIDCCPSVGSVALGILLILCVANAQAVFELCLWVYIPVSFVLGQCAGALLETITFGRVTPQLLAESYGSWHIAPMRAVEL